MKLVIKLNIKKDYILYFSICFIIIISILVLNTYCNSSSTINLEYPDSLRKGLEFYRKEIDSYKDTSCKSFVEDYIDTMEVGLIEGEYSVKEIYNYLLTLNVLDYYQKGNESCNIDEDTKSIIANLYVNIMVERASVIHPYLYQYEIKLDDIARERSETTLIDIHSYNALKNSENSLLKMYMNSLRKENINE